MDMETFMRHGHDPFAKHFEDPGPNVPNCPFARDPQRHYHDTSPPRRYVLARSKLWDSRQLDAMRRKVSLVLLVVSMLIKFTTVAEGGMLEIISAAMRMEGDAVGRGVKEIHGTGKRLNLGER